MKVIVTRRRLTGKWYIKLVAGNGETVASTQRYFSKSNALRSARDIADSANSERWTVGVDRKA